MKEKITFKYILRNFDAVITMVTLTACIILVNVNVIMRYLFKSPLQWSEEVVTGLFVWTVFIGSAFAHRKRAHLGVDIVVNLLPDKTNKVISTIVAFLQLAILIMVTIISTQYVYHSLYVRGHYKPTLTDVLRIPKAYFAAAVPIGFGLSTIYAIRDLLTDTLHIFKKKNTDDEIKIEGGNY